jgi:hypothetical protein
MAKSTLKDRVNVVRWLRESRLFIKNADKVESVEDLELAELEASLEYALLWKRHLSAMYDAVYAESKFLKEVRYFYKKNGFYLFAGNGVDKKEVDFWEHQALKRLADSNGYMQTKQNISWNEFHNEYRNYHVNGKGFKFEPSDKHKDMLDRMDEINKISKQAVKILSTLKEQISHKMAIASLENKRIIKKLDSKPIGTERANEQVKKD